MRAWKKQLAVLAIGGCLLFALTACGASETTEGSAEDQVSYAEDIQKRKDAEAAEQAEEETEEITVESDAEGTEEDSDSEEELTEENSGTDTDSSDDSEDGEARNEISMTDALASIKSQFGTQDENGQAYEYTLDSVAEIGDREYYVYRMSWAADEQDAEAYKKTLNYIFVATDGSTIHTGNVDEDGYDIDYTS